MVKSNVSGTTASSDKGLCGGDEYPCNHVGQCLTGREDVVKEMIIRGQYPSSTTIVISNNVSIRGVDNATVTGPSRSFFIEIQGNNTKLSINVTNIRFRIGILKIDKPANVSIINCTIAGVDGSVVLLNRLYPEK